MSENVTRAAYEAAQKVSGLWLKQEAERRAREGAQARKEREATVAALMDEMGDLSGWALEEWARAKASGVGQLMSEDEAIGYYLGQLKSKMATVESAREWAARNLTAPLSVSGEDQ